MSQEGLAHESVNARGPAPRAIPNGMGLACTSNCPAHPETEGLQEALSGHIITRSKRTAQPEGSDPRFQVSLGFRAEGPDGCRAHAIALEGRLEEAAAVGSRSAAPAVLMIDVLPVRDGSHRIRPQ